MDNNSEVVYLYLDDIIPNRFQPREVFDDQALKELAVSIKEHGVIQPIIVRKVENKYEIIAGERRYKASTMAGLTKIPAIVKNLDDKESSKVALIENLQRKDLSPIEEARTYQKILELEDNMTQEELAATMGKTQSSVSNKLRLLELPEEIQDALLKEKISERHARSLLTIEDKNDQIKMMDKVIAEKMTVRELEKEIKILKGEISDVSPIPETASTETESVSATPEASFGLANDFGSMTTQATTEDTTSNESTESNMLDNIELPKPDLDSFISPSGTTEQETSTSEFNINQPSIESDTSASTDNKFIPEVEETTDSNNSANSDFGTYSSYFNANINNDANSSIASSITSEGIVAPATKDINKAITDVKNTITNLQNNGYKVSFEESDDMNGYKISIQIDKN